MRGCEWLPRLAHDGLALWDREPVPGMLVTPTAWIGTRADMPYGLVISVVDREMLVLWSGQC